MQGRAACVVRGLLRRRCHQRLLGAPILSFQGCLRSYQSGPTYASQVPQITKDYNLHYKDPTRSQISENTPGEEVAIRLSQLADLAVDPQKCQQCLKQGAVLHILEAMKDFPEDAMVQERAALALWRLSGGGGDESVAKAVCREVLTQSGLPTIFSALSQHFKALAVLNNMHLAVANLAFGGLAAEVVAAGELGQLAASLEHYPTNVSIVEAVVIAMSALFENTKTELDLVNSGLLQQLTRIMRHIPAHTTLQDRCSLLFVSILRRDSSHRVLLEECGVVALCSGWLAGCPTGAGVGAHISLLTHLVVLNVENAKTVIEQGAMAGLCEAMRHNLESAGIQEAGCALLQALGMRGKSHPALEKSGAVRALTDALSHHGANEHVVEVAFCALLNVGFSLSAQIVEHAELILQTMVRYKNHKPLLENMIFQHGSSLLYFLHLHDPVAVKAVISRPNAAGNTNNTTTVYPASRTAWPAWLYNTP
eukprot:gnl/Hemi2/12843_TR4384_c0_g1_i1.p1 gnl/Hemi2/12843_TR4384_c0_g1~~gnl/Hemi2/12843_TR4384_c0_g1_i1.p1  ORF type:complete len:499 (-),score=104.31 gnl/Hemi2/12843_TR4384_c0_g1_i1:34-1473(-)